MLSSALRLLLLLLWWTWSLYTWTTNWTGTDSLGIKLSLIGAMAAALVMSAAVADAFTTGGTWFALSYLIVRIFVAAMYWMGSRRAPMPENPKEEYAKYETYLRNVIHQNKGLRCSIQDLAARS